MRTYAIYNYAQDIYNHYFPTHLSIKYSHRLSLLLTKTFKVDATMGFSRVSLGLAIGASSFNIIAIPLTSLEVILPTRGMFDTFQIWIYLSEGHKQRKQGAERKSLEQKNRKLNVFFY